MTCSATILAWTAAEVKDALRRRHSATQSMGVRTVPGPWTCIEELLGCDLIAFSAVRYPKNASRGACYPRVGYEVKVSRSDYRVELRNPDKRSLAVAQCHEFYFAVPAGLLKPEEKADNGDPERYAKSAPPPALWVPRDVGLIEVTRGGCRVVKPSPVRPEPRAIDGPLVGLIARHVSSHPDPRHDGVVERDRALSRELRERQRLPDYFGDGGS